MTRANILSLQKIAVKDFRRTRVSFLSPMLEMAAPAVAVASIVGGRCWKCCSGSPAILLHLGFWEEAGGRNKQFDRKQRNMPVMR